MRWPESIAFLRRRFTREPRRGCRDYVTGVTAATARRLQLTVWQKFFPTGADRLQVNGFTTLCVELAYHLATGLPLK